MTTLEKLKIKASSSFGSNIKMPSIIAISKMLKEFGVEHELSESVNIVEYRSKGMRYVNSRHRGKEGKRLTIRPNQEDAEKSGINYIQLDSSDSYYSSNTWGYASRIIELLEKTGKI